jgi:hypothetical protein
VSKRSKRRQGPHRESGEGQAESRRAAEPGEAGGARQDEPRLEAGGRSPRSPGEARQAAGGRSPRSPGEARRAGRGGARGRPAEGVTSRSPASGWSLAVQLAFLVAVFAVVVLIAELAGAANLGVALGVGQIAFAIAVIYLLVRR